MGFEYGKGRRGIARVARVLLITLALFSTVSIASAQTDDEETAAPDLNLLEPKRSNSKELLDMPSLTLEHLNHAADIADSGNLPSMGDASEGGDGEDEEHSKEHYDELAAKYKAQRETVKSFSGRDDISATGACKADIEKLCAADLMVDGFKPVTGDEGTTPRRALLEEDGGKTEGTDSGVSSKAATEEDKDKRIADLEAKVNALANSMVYSKDHGSTSSNKEAKEWAMNPKLVTGTESRHMNRKFESYFDCLHSNVVATQKTKGIDLALNVFSRKGAVSKRCRKEVSGAYAERFSDISTDAELLEVCGGEGDNKLRGGDVGKFCADVETGLGLVFRCLKSHKEKLSKDCQTLVTARQVEQAEDVSLDTPLALMCEDDRKKLCAETEWGGGATEQCLKDKRQELSTQCKLEVFRREVEESEDVRFDGFFAEKCSADKEAFCADVKPGEGRVVQCLESHARDAKFSAECRAVLDRRGVRRAADWRLDFKLKKACKPTVKKLCGDAVKAAKAKVSASGGVLECLKTQLAAEKIEDETCRAEVQRTMVAAANDIRQDTSLTLACRDELMKHCKDVEPGEGRLWTCLAANRKKASKTCEDKLFTRELWMTGDWRYKYGLSTKCASERQVLCSGVPAGSGRVVMCLQSKADHEKMGKECRDAIAEDQRRSLDDIRLHEDLSKSCKDDAKALCTPVNPGEGRMIKCLREKRQDIAKPECRAALLRAMMSSADNYLMDRPLAAACVDDVEKHCSAITPGQGRVHECLREKEGELSPACKKAEIELEAVEVEDIRLKPRLMEACQLSATKLCANIKPGNGNLLECLQAKATEDGMDAKCAKALRGQSIRENKHLAFNLRVKQACKTEVPKLCQVQADDASINVAAVNATVDPMMCLISKRAEIENNMCSRVLKGSIKRAFVFYVLGTEVTKACDDEASRFCGATEESQRFQAPGSVVGCLARSTEHISDACWVTLSAAVDEKKVEPGSIGEEVDVAMSAALEAEIERRVENKILSTLGDHITKHVDRIKGNLNNDGSIQTALGHVDNTANYVAQLATQVSELAWMVFLGLILTCVVSYLALRRVFSALAKSKGVAGNQNSAKRVHDV